MIKIIDKKDCSGCDVRAQRVPEQWKDYTEHCNKTKNIDTVQVFIGTFS